MQKEARLQDEADADQKDGSENDGILQYKLPDGNCNVTYTSLATKLY